MYSEKCQKSIAAVEAVDECVGKAVDAVKEVNGQMFICADHGNAEQLVDYLVDVAGWAKVQDRIYTADLDSYIRFYDYATKGYYIEVKGESLMYDFQKDEFMVYDNKKYAPRYAEDKAFCDEAASRLASARVELFRGQVLRDTEIRLKSSAEAATEVPETPLPKDPTQ